MFTAAAGFAQQPRPERPYRGLFASGVATDTEQLLTVNGSAGVGYDTSVLADAGEALVGGADPRTRSDKGSYLLLSEGLSYSLNKDRVDLGVNASASSRYYPTLDRGFISSYGGGIGATWSASRRTRLTASQTMSYQPFNLSALVPVFQISALGQPFLADLDFHTLDAEYFTYTTSAGASRELSARSTLSGDYQYTRSDFSGYPNFSSHGGGVRFTRGITANVGLRIGYGYTLAHYSAGDDVGRHLIDTGVDYNKTLSFSRRTTLSFSTGGSAVTERGDTYFTGIGSARFNHEIGRTWDFTAGYNRNIGFIETFSSPFVYDSASVSLGGLLGRRWSFESSASASLGNIGLGSTAQDNDFDTYQATTGVSRALNRHLSIGVNYSFYRYHFSESTLLPAGFNEELSRHSVRATLSAWLPLMQRGRRGNAAR